MFSSANTDYSYKLFPAIPLISRSTILLILQLLIRDDTAITLARYLLMKLAEPEREAPANT